MLLHCSSIALVCHTLSLPCFCISGFGKHFCHLLVFLSIPGAWCGFFFFWCSWCLSHLICCQSHCCAIVTHVLMSCHPAISYACFAIFSYGDWPWHRSNPSISWDSTIGKPYKKFQRLFFPWFFRVQSHGKQLGVFSWFVNYSWKNYGFYREEIWKNLKTFFHYCSIFYQ